MATRAEIAVLLAELQKAPPSEGFKSIDGSNAGIRAILTYLSETSEMVTAGRLSEVMHVSTARVAVLLKKMVDKGLIEKASDPSDARVVVVRLSAQGVKTAEKIREDMYAQVGLMIDTIGAERMMEFAAISQEIHAMIKATDIDSCF